MNLAAVDIGSNATRLTIARPPSNRDYYTPNDLIEKLRFPCRLGSEVFKDGKISDEKASEMHEIFKQIHQTILSSHVSKAKVAATSAFRDASNGPELLKQFADEFKLNCKILSGLEEATYMSEGLKRRDLFDPEHTHLHMDLGGGSLELSVFNNEDFLFQESLDVGALRLVEDTTSGELKANWKEQLKLIDDCFDRQDSLDSSIDKPLKAFGTGGNFKRLGIIKEENLDLEDASHFSPDDLSEMLELFKNHPGQKLCEITTIKPDNAALIVPSILIVQRVLKFWPADRIEIPDLTLSHTLLDSLI